MRILAVEAQIEVTDVLCAAALHDFLEDSCGGPGQLPLDKGRAVLLKRFGPDVLAHVEAVSDDKSLPKDMRKRLQVEHAGHATHAAKLVKLADKIANLRDIRSSPPTDWSLERRQAYFDWVEAVVDQIRGTHSQLETIFDSIYADRPMTM